MRGPCGIVCAGGLTVTCSRHSACHQGVLETLYIRLHAAGLPAASNNNSRIKYFSCKGPKAIKSICLAALGLTKVRACY